MVARGYDAAIYAGEQCSPLLNIYGHLNANFDFMLFRQSVRATLWSP